MTIKQQGGIFGRNPTFNDAEANDLQVNTKAHFPDNAELTFGNSDDLLITHDGSSSKITDQGNGPLLISGTNIILQNAAGDQRHIDCNDGGTVEIWHADGKRIQTESYGAQLFGNLKFNSAGDGIDFSATSGTGTSELFDDYEEGTWTPAYDSTNSDLTATIGSSTNCVYTKIGNTVYIEGFVGVTGGTVTAGTGGVLITGLPYAAAAPGGISIVRNNDWGADNHPVSGYINTGDSYIQLKKLPADPRDEIIDCDASLVLNGGNDNGIYFFGHYRTS